MFSLLIVDDEPWALVGIQEIIPWDEYGFNPVRAVGNPLEALGIILENPPDVVVTDIKMPDMTGLDLIKAGREREISSEFVIVSGFGEFSYAREAIELGAFSYLLKPLEERVVAELACRLKEHLSNKRKEHRRDAGASLADALFYGSEDLQDLLRTNGFKFRYELYLAAILECKAYGSPPEDFLFPGSDSISVRLANDRRLFLVNGSANRIEEGLCMNLRPDALQDSNLGISSKSPDYLELPAKCREADIAFHKRFVSRVNGCYRYSRNSIQAAGEFTAKIIGGLEARQLETVKSALREIPQAMSEAGAGIEEAAYLYNQVIAYLSYRHCRDNFYDEYGFMDHSSLSRKFQDITVLCSELCRMVDCFYGESPVGNPDNVCSSFRELLDFVNGSYQEELYLNDLSQQFHFSISHICMMFKRELGKTFSEYVTDLRMAKAVELLKGTDLPVAEIAQSLGYNDYFYFSKLFKKCHRVPPTRYRKGETA